MQKLHINASTQYDILVGNGILKDCGDIVKTVSTAEKAVIVTDDIVAALYLPAVKKALRETGYLVEEFVFPHGEGSKCHSTLIQLYDFLCDCNVTRGDLLIALGGGVVGDLTGYCAATYLRGIDYIQIPTTLLAQIDSSVGGKTAVDTSRGKNLIGAFKQPALVLCDIDTLNTLTPEIFSDGMAEAIKYGLIKDCALFEMIASGDIKNNLEKMIMRCIEIKAQIVEADEFDKGERMLLNFGHTIGHSIERQYHYETYTHGSAVGVGMVYISALFEKKGVTPTGTTEKVKSCLALYHLPCTVEITPEQIYTYSVNDKKRNKQTINLIVLEKIGSAFIHKMPIEEYASLLNGLQAALEQ